MRAASACRCRAGEVFSDDVRRPGKVVSTAPAPAPRSSKGATVTRARVAGPGDDRGPRRDRLQRRRGGQAASRAAGLPSVRRVRATPRRQVVATDPAGGRARSSGGTVDRPVCTSVAEPRSLTSICGGHHGRTRRTRRHHHRSGPGHRPRARAAVRRERAPRSSSTTSAAPSTAPATTARRPSRSSTRSRPWAARPSPTPTTSPTGRAASA